MEFGVPAWNSTITVGEVNKLERVQKIAVRIIYGKDKSYRRILEDVRLETLSARRERLSKLG